MTYILIVAIIIIGSSFRAISFAIWQFKNRNIFGGIMVFLLAISASALILMQL